MSTSNSASKIAAVADTVISQANDAKCAKGIIDSLIMIHTWCQSDATNDTKYFKSQ